jgi:GxxExxY protein
MNTMKSGNAENTEISQNSQKEFNEITREVIGAAVEVQKALGIGLLESAYAAALEIELKSRNIFYEREVPVRASYKNQDIGVVYRADLIVEDELIVEIKAVDTLLDIHKAQLLTYLRLTKLPVGLLLNFHDISVAKSAKRLINNWY